MRQQTFRAVASALLLLATAVNAHKGTHEHLEAIHRRHREDRIAKRANETGELVELNKRGTCAFPTGAGLVAVTPGSMNAGWAMSPDEACTPGSYCPYACPPGEVMMQWDPSATSYTYPQSMNGGLYCDSNGQVSKPFPSKPYCQATAGNIGVVNNCGGVVSFCQTVLPGNEAMLIPTAVQSSATLAVPGTDYWAGTAAHYYINPPGTDPSTACVWGTNANPWGNWSPYVAGANVDNSGNTFIKLGWNPIYLEAATPFRNTMPNWGVKIDCPNGGCEGLPCAIDPSTNKVNQMTGGQSSGAGGGNFCVVTVNKGSQANFVVYQSGWGNNNINNNNNQQGGQFYHSWSASSSSATTTTAPTTTSQTTTTAQSWSAVSNTTTTAYTTTTSGSKPTGQPYYNLFNTTIPSHTSDSLPVPSQPAETSTTTEGPVLTHTGGAATIAINLLTVAPLALWAVL